MHTPITLGLFINSTQDSYEAAIVRGVSDVLRAAGAHLICFTSGALRSYHGFEAQRNVLYDLVTPKSVDGLIVCGTLAHPVSRPEILAFLKRYDAIPMVSIALAAPDIPNIMADSRQGIAQIMAHMLDVHAYRRIAFIRGPLGHEEAEERYQAYSQALKAHGIRQSKALVLQGDFTYESGARAVAGLLASGKPFEAIVAANDSMALGAISVLRQAGKRIPADVAVTGFDDTMDGRFAPVPLTTVRQSAYDQGRQAASFLLDRLSGQPVPGRVIAPVAMVVRRSCGCSASDLPSRFISPSLSPDWQSSLAERHPEILEAVRRKVSHIQPEIVQAWVDSWLDALMGELQGAAAGAFLRSVETVFESSRNLLVELGVWNRALDGFAEQVYPCLPAEQLGAAKRLIEQGQRAVGEITERVALNERIQADYLTYTLRDIGEAMMTSFDLSGLLDVLQWELARLPIQTACLALYDDPQKPAEQSRLIFGWHRERRISLPVAGRLFPSCDLLPEDLWSEFNYDLLVVEALYSKDDRLGFVLLGLEPRDVSICGVLRGLLSSALQGVLLLQQRSQAQNQLEKMVAQLEASNNELESFAYSVSHDLRAPLRAVVGYASILKMEYGDKLDQEGLNYLLKIQQNGKRMGILIDDLLEFSRVGRRAMALEEVDMRLIAYEIMEELSPEYKGRALDVRIGDLPTCVADSSLMRQVWANLLGNAIKYTRTRNPARIEVGSFLQEDRPVYFVRDNGAGFDMHYADKLFGVFQRLHLDTEFEGTGVGLATVQRILHRHGGRIWAEAAPGLGATFYFTL